MNWLNFVYHPMVATSVMLHGLVLLIPMPPEPAAEPEPPPTEAVQLSSISSLKVNPKPSPPAAPAMPKPVVKPVVQAALPPRPRPPLPPPAQSPPVSPPAATPTPAISPTPLAVVTPSPEPSATPTAPLSQGQLQSQSVQGVAQASAAQFYSSFPEPSAFFTPESLQQADANLTDPIPVEGITNMTRLERIGVSAALSQILPQMYTGASFTPIGTYGGGDVYEVKQANSVGYVVLVKEKSLSLATYIVEWNRNPNQPSQTSSQTIGEPLLSPPPMQ